MKKLMPGERIFDGNGPMSHLPAFGRPGVSLSVRGRVINEDLDDFSLGVLNYEQIITNPQSMQDKED